MKIAENLQEMLTYIKYNIEGRKEVSIISSSDTLMEFIGELKSYGRKLSSFSCEIDFDSEIYVITKYLNEINKECLMIEPLIQYNEETEDFEYIYVKDEFVIVEEYSMGEEEIRDIIKSDEFEILGLIEDHPELQEKEDDECDCSVCEDFSCEQNCNLDNEEDDEKSLLDEYVEKIQELGFIGCPHCLKEFLDELCYEVYSEGRDDEAKALHEALEERLYGED